MPLIHHPREGASRVTRKRQRRSAPDSFIWCHDGCAEMPACSRTKGKGQPSIAEMPVEEHPSQQFIWSQKGCAEMPLRDRSKGKGHPARAKCHLVVTLPNQLQGAIMTTQQYQNQNAPTEFGPSNHRRNADKDIAQKPEAKILSQKCHVNRASLHKEGNNG